MYSVILENRQSYFIDFEMMPEGIQEMLRKTGSFMIKGAQFSQKYRNGTWDGRQYLLTKAGAFPTGLAGVLLQAAKEKGYDIRIENRIKYPDDSEKVGYSWNKQIVLRDYQLEAVGAATKKHRGIIGLPTRSGKTFTAAGMIHSIGFKALVIVAGVDSIKQTIADYKLCLPDAKIGAYGGGKKDHDCDILVGVIESFRKAKGAELEYFRSFPILLIDEVHKAGSDTMYKFCLKLDAPFRFGMSGTAFRTDNRDLMMMATCGRVIFFRDQVEMWDEGSIIRPTVYWVDVLDKAIHRSLDFRRHYEEGIVRCDVRNRLVGDILDRHMGEQTLISVESVEHGKILHSMYLKLGAVLVTGADSAEYRDRCFSEFKEGRIRILISTRITNQSLTFPDLSVLINCAGRKSAIELMQKCGRVQGKGNKGAVSIYDFWDGHSHHLVSHSSSRMKALKKCGYEQIRLGHSV